jgi:hypothetical protein
VAQQQRKGPEPRRYEPTQPSSRLKRPVGMASLSRSVRQSGDPPDVFVGTNVNAGGGNRTRPRFQPGRAGALAFDVSVVSLRAQVRSAADQIVETLPAPDPACLPSCVALLASSEPSPVVWIDETGPDRGWFGEAKASDEREWREDDAE